MSSRLLSRSVLLAVCLMLCSGGFAAPALAAPSDKATRQMQRDEGDTGANPHDIVQGSHVEGHIAFLKAELAITPAQEQLWAPVAAAMREDVRNLWQADRDASRHNGPENALEYLQNRVHFAELRAQGEERFLSAFEPLYNSLSDAQKRSADELLIPDDPQE